MRTARIVNIFEVEMFDLLEICAAIVVFALLGWKLWRMSNDTKMMYRLSHDRPNTSISRGLTKLSATAFFIFAGLSVFGLVLWIVDVCFLR